MLIGWPPAIQYRTYFLHVKGEPTKGCRQNFRIPGKTLAATSLASAKLPELLPAPPTKKRPCSHLLVHLVTGDGEIADVSVRASTAPLVGLR